MNDFERQYYESEGFWKDTLQDPLNQQRIRDTASIIPGNVKTLLDVGCGNGIFLNYLKANNESIKTLGIDRSESALKYLQSDKLVGSITDLPLEDQSYDCVTCLEVLEHIPFDVYNKALKEIARVAKEYLIVSVPYNEDLEENRNQCPECKSVFNVDLHFRTFSREKMHTLFKGLGFSPIQTMTLGVQYFLKGQKAYSRIIYPNNYKVFNAPICPVCGYKLESVPAAKKVTGQKVETKKNVLSLITRLPKMVWPKGKRHYWIMCLYKRDQVL